MSAMKSVLLGLAIGLVATQANAISRYNTSGLSCGEVRAIIDQDGAAIMRYRSTRSGAQLYGRYVRDGRWCAGSERPEASYITTADSDQCRVRECKPYSFDDDNILFRDR
jgi:hypothetical protein